MLIKNFNIYIYWRFYETEPTRCLLQLAIENNKNHPEASDAIKCDMYVDDFLSGANSLENATQLKNDVTKIFKGAGMSLRKWCSNKLELLADVDDVDKEQFVEIDNRNCIKTLGIYWEAAEDVFRIKINQSIEHMTTPVTKRNVISEVARIFDPIGVMAPVTVLGKMFMQQLWKLNIHWDQCLPQHLHTQWINYRNSLHALNSLSIPRHLFQGCCHPTSIQLHGFADASERAYGCVLYVRYQNGEQIGTSLLCSKSRIAPTKTTVTIPRLELCAAQLLSKSMKRVKNIVNFPVDNLYYWTDSMITIQWIQSSCSRWNTYVANRVADIQTNSNVDKWFHVRSSQNLADIVSRGSSPYDLIKSKLWWQGPDFLRDEDMLQQQMKPIPLNESEAPEERKRVHSLITTIPPENDILTKLQSISSYPKMQNVIGWILRFIAKCKKSSARTSATILSGSEAKRAELVLLRLVQKAQFHAVYKGFEGTPNFIVRDSMLRSLDLFMDEHKLLQIGGRLRWSSLAYTSKHPILLPADHFITIPLAEH